VGGPGVSGIGGALVRQAPPHSRGAGGSVYGNCLREIEITVVAAISP